MDTTIQKLSDRNWRIDNLYKILNKDGILVPYKRNYYQERFDNEMHGRDIILKSRQVGFTTHFTCCAFDLLCFTKNFYAMFIAHEKKEADQILQNKMPVLWDNFKLKDYASYKVLHEKAGEFRIAFSENESVNSFIRAGTSGVSGTYQFMHISELAPMERKEKERANEVLLGTLSVPIDGRIIIESTARGNYGTFYDMFMESWDKQQKGYKLGRTEYKAHFYNWLQDPEIQKITKEDYIPLNQMKNSEFFRERVEQYKLTEQQLNWWYSKFGMLKYDLNLLLQDYPLSISDAFRGSSDAYFNQQLLDMQATRPHIFEEGGWKFFSRYKPGHLYAIGADPAGGKGGDNAACIVIDFTDHEVCAIYKNRFTPPGQLGEELAKMGKAYGNCIIGVEINNHGHAVIEKLKALNYGNIYSRLHRSEYSDKDTKELGFLTSSSTKPIILSNLSLAINEFSLYIVSEELKTELSRYPRDASDSTYDKEELGHFDLVMSCAIAWEMRKSVANA